MVRAIWGTKTSKKEKKKKKRDKTKIHELNLLDSWNPIRLRALFVKESFLRLSKKKKKTKKRTKKQKKKKKWSSLSDEKKQKQSEKKVFDLKWHPNNFDLNVICLSPYVICPLFVIRRQRGQTKKLTKRTDFGLFSHCRNMGKQIKTKTKTH